MGTLVPRRLKRRRSPITTSMLFRGRCLRIGGLGLRCSYVMIARTSHCFLLFLSSYLLDGDDALSLRLVTVCRDGFFCFPLVSPFCFLMD